jgi:hypothetical protein
MFTAHAAMEAQNSSPAPSASPPGLSDTQWWLRALQMERPTVPLL